LPKIKAVIFDLDGTLVKFTLDYKSLRREAISALARYSAPSSILSVYEPIFKTLEKAALYLRNNGATEETINKAYDEVIDLAEKYEMDAALCTDIIPGAEITLQNLKEAGVKIGLCTNNGLKAVRYLIRKYRLRDYFDNIVTRESIPNMKPDTGHFLAAIAPLRVRPEEAMMVGDSIIDIKTAKPLGATVVGIQSIHSANINLKDEGADYIIDSITDVPEILRALNAASNQTF
jgi:phosphoglycolate phosphatase